MNRAALSRFVWQLFNRSLLLSLSLNDEAGRKIMFDLKCGDFSGPPLLVQALNELMEVISRPRNEAKLGED